MLTDSQSTYIVTWLTFQKPQSISFVDWWPLNASKDKKRSLATITEFSQEGITRYIYRAQMNGVVSGQKYSNKLIY